MSGGEVNGGVLQMGDVVDGKTVELILREKHPKR